MRKITAFSLTLIFILMMSLSALSVSAESYDYQCDVETASANVYIEDLNTGNVIYTKNPDERVSPASLTKVMTYIVVTENIPDPLNTTITVTEQALANLDPESSVMGLTGYIGSQFSVLDLLYGLMLPSGNDAALVLADYIGDGSVDNFVDMMNRKAGQLGCTGTHFVNSHGLHDSMHYSTIYDLAIITKYALNQPYFKDITSTPRYQAKGMTEVIENTNYLLDANRPQYYYQYATGVKTGYTDQAGKCLISTAKKDEYEYLCIALGSPYSYAEDINYAMLDTVDLYEWAFNNISYSTILSTNEVVDSLPIEFVWGSEPVDIVPSQDVTALLPNDYDPSLITTQMELPEYLRATVEKGEVVGSVTVLYDGKSVGTTDLVSSVTVERDQSNYLMHRMIGFIVNNIIWLSVVFAIVVALVVFNINNRRRRKKRQACRRYR